MNKMSKQTKIQSKINLENKTWKTWPNIDIFNADVCNDICINGVQQTNKKQFHASAIKIQTYQTYNTKK